MYHLIKKIYKCFFILIYFHLFLNIVLANENSNTSYSFKLLKQCMENMEQINGCIKIFQKEHNNFSLDRVSIDILFQQGYLKQKLCCSENKNCEYVIKKINEKTWDVICPLHGELSSLRLFADYAKYINTYNNCHQQMDYFFNNLESYLKKNPNFNAKHLSIDILKDNKKISSFCPLSDNKNKFEYKVLIDNNLLDIFCPIHGRYFTYSYVAQIENSKSNQIQKNNTNDNLKLCRQNMQVIRSALELYNLDYPNIKPSNLNVSTLVEQKYLKSHLKCYEIDEKDNDYKFDDNFNVICPIHGKLDKN